MKQHNKRFFFTTVGLISVGIAVLAFSTVQAKEQIAKELSSKTKAEQTVASFDTMTENSTMVANETVATSGAAIKRDTTDSSKQKKASGFSEDFAYIPFYDLKNYVEEDKWKVTEYTYAYRGHVISIVDDMVDKSTKKKHAEVVVDCILDILQPDLFEQLQIDVENYSFSLSRQYQIPEHTYYSVLFKKNNKGLASVLVDVDNRAIISFMQDGLITITESFDEVEEKYKVETWSDKKKTQIYEKFLPKAQEILNNKMKLPTIMDGTFDPTNEDYISRNGEDTLISLGYQLENGMFVKLVFDQVSMDWDGFVMLGGDTERLASSSFNQTKEGKAMLKKYGFSEA